MNSPLRYSGLTFYQYQMGADDVARQAGQAFSVLQVVRNPSWLTPYIGCFLVALGLVMQFMFHLVKFLSRQQPAEQRAAAGAAAVNGTAKAARPGKRALQESVRK
jgi:cytochrome c biogenesis protein ResB